MGQSERPPIEPRPTSVPAPSPVPPATVFGAAPMGQSETSLMYWHRKRCEARAVEMCRIGDELQSEASRLAEWVRNECEGKLPYEALMALVAVESRIEAWTELRKLPELPRSL